MDLPCSWRNFHLSTPVSIPENPVALSPGSICSPFTQDCNQEINIITKEVNNAKLQRGISGSFVGVCCRGCNSR